MTKLEQVLGLSDGASFFRGDLHIHSYPNSHDVTDQAMTPAAVVSTAVGSGLSLIAITDHNEISGVQDALNAAVGTSLVVIPGVELSTSDGHLLCYLPDLSTLQQFHGRLKLADRGLANSRCTTGMLECISLADDLGGFCVLAHVDGPKGFEVEVPGNAPHKVDVLKHMALLGIELKNSSTDISYSPSDPDPGRKHIGTQRAIALGLGSRQFVARVVSSDAHKLANVGRNAAGDKRVTRYKMQRPSFHGLRHALLDAEVRVRIEDEIPFAVPHVLGLHMDGSFFSDVTIRLSTNLNCIIGGRGAGKSTTLEAIRLLSPDGGEAYMVDSEVWPTEIDFFWKDQAGQTTWLNRLIGEAVQNNSDPSEGQTSSIWTVSDKATQQQSAKVLRRILSGFFATSTSSSTSKQRRQRKKACARSYSPLQPQSTKRRNK